MAATSAGDLTGGDPSGSNTFARYRYQSKLTLLYWLGTLLPNGPHAVFAEHVEDILIEYRDLRFVFVQVKTRIASAGYWTADHLCDDGGGIDSLCRAYAVASATNCSFELHLEGTTSPSPATADLVKSCASATASIRAKISGLLRDALGREPLISELDDFLARLRIVPNQPSQLDIDARCLRLLMRLSPSMPGREIEELYGRLLQIVESAQDASNASLGAEATGVDYLEAQIRLLSASETDEETTIASKRLSRERLAEFLPLEQEATVLLLLERILDDRPLTALEEKLMAAGANNVVVQDARSLRAMAEPRRFELLSGPEAQSGQLDDVTNRVLMRARALAQLSNTAGESANDLWARLLTDPGLVQTDQGGLFNGDTFSILGFLCCLSDECKFAWRVS